MSGREGVPSLLATSVTLLTFQAIKRCAQLVSVWHIVSGALPPITLIVKRLRSALARGLSLSLQ